MDTPVIFYINFLLAEGEKPRNIFERLQTVFSDIFISLSAFYIWVSQFPAIEPEFVPSLKGLLGLCPSPDRQITLQEVPDRFSINLQSLS